MVIRGLRRDLVGAAQRRRALVLLAGIGLWAALLLGRLVHLQFLMQEELAERARRQHLWTVELPARRGRLLDREGRPLAISIDQLSIYAHPHRLPDPEEAATALARALEVEPARLARRLRTEAPFVWLVRKARPQVAEAVRALVEARGWRTAVGFIEESQRYYPNRSLAAHVLGFVDLDNRGQAGVELAYDELIRGKPGRWLTLRDGGNNPVDPDGLLRQEPTMGYDLVLTLDAVIQYAAETALREAVEANGASGGAAVALDVRTGAVLAMASYPTFNPNVRDRALVRNSANRAILHAYEPGSSFKIFTTAAALQEGLVAEEEIIDCQGGVLRVGSHTYHDWMPGLGALPFSQVLATSSNVGMIKVALRMPPEHFYGWLRAFGFGERTGIDLPGEASGTVRPTGGWSALSHSSMAIGQELSATPLQLAAAAAAVANGGWLLQPYVVARVEDHQGRTARQHQPTARRRVLQEQVARRVLALLEQVVAGRGATGWTAAIPGYRVAGKTGTAQKVGPDGRYSEYVSSFVGVLPASEPRLAVVVLIDAPTRRYYGSQVAAPAFRAIAEAAIHALRIPPDAARPPVRTVGGS